MGPKVFSNESISLNSLLVKYTTSEFHKKLYYYYYEL